MTAKAIATTTVAALSVFASMVPASAFYMDKANMVSGVHMRSGKPMETAKIEKSGCFVTYSPADAERGIRYYREDC